MAVTIFSQFSLVSPRLDLDGRKARHRWTGSLTIATCPLSAPLGRGSEPNQETRSRKRRSSNAVQLNLPAFDEAKRASSAITDS